MASLAVRILRCLAANRHGLTRSEIDEQFPAYRQINVGIAVDRLTKHGLLSRLPISDSLGRYSITDLGRAQASSTTPPRWSAPRRRTPRFSPRTATIAK